MQKNLDALLARINEMEKTFAVDAETVKVNGHGSSCNCGGCQCGQSTVAGVRG